MEWSLGSQLKFSAGRARPCPCHMQSTVARLCSTQGSFYGAVSSNSQPTVLGQYLVTCRWPRLACAPHEGDFLNSFEEDHLPIYSVVTFWQGEYTHNELFGKPCFGEFLWSGPWAVSSNSQPTALTHPLVTCSRPWLACAPRSTWECFPRICSHLTQACLLDPFVLPYEGD